MSENPMKDIVEQDMKDLAPMKDTPIAPAHGIAALALNMAIKYHDMQMIPDGLTYQQYKMEGRNIRSIGLDDVFETAIRMEAFLLGSSQRIAKLVVDAIAFVDEDQPPQTDDPNLPSSPEGTAE